jgi:thioredoxin-related protein
MKIIILPIILLLFVATGLRAGDTKNSGTELKWKKLTTGLAEAKKSNKKVLLDVYTDWCKWCKKLDAEVYSETNISAYLQKKYVTIKLNAESTDSVTYQGKPSTEAELAQAFGVTGYPTIIFLDAEGQPIDKLGGFVNAEQFLPIIKFIGDDSYKSTSWEEYQKQNGKK